MSFTLLEDQKEIVQETRDMMADGVKWVLIQSPTGSGKSVIGADIVHGVMQKKKRCLYTVPRIELIKQTAWTFREYGLNCSVIASGFTFNPFEDLILSTTQSLGRLVSQGKAPEVDLAMVDETHYYAGQVDNIVEHYKAKGAWGIGMSATPRFFSGKGLGCWYDGMVKGKSVRWLIENRRLSDYRLFAPNIPDLSSIGTFANDYKKDELIEYMKTHGKIVGDAVKHYQKHAMGKLAICYCVSVEEAEKAAIMFNNAGIPADSIDGTMSDEERGIRIRRFARREILVLTNCELLTFGFDLKSASGMDAVIEAMIDLGPTKSLAKQMQKWGRVLRKKDDPALIFDHVGNSMIHGLPDDDRDWTLEGIIKAARPGTGGGIPVKQCNGGWSNQDMSGIEMEPCYFVHRPAPKCPNCGCWYETNGRSISTIEGELTETRAPLRNLTSSEIDRRNLDIDELTARGIRMGMPAHKAREWAAEKINAALQKKLQKEQDVMNVSLVVGSKELTLFGEE